MTTRVTVRQPRPDLAGPRSPSQRTRTLTRGDHRDDTQQHDQEDDTQETTQHQRVGGPPDRIQQRRVDVGEIVDNPSLTNRPDSGQGDDTPAPPHQGGPAPMAATRQAWPPPTSQASALPA